MDPTDTEDKCRQGSLWQPHLDTPHRASDDHRAGFPLPLSAPLLKTDQCLICYAFNRDSFFINTELYNLLLCRQVMLKLHFSGVLAFDLQMSTDAYFPPVCLCVWWLCGLIEICDRSTGYNGPLDECPWAPGLLSSLLGGWQSLGGVSSAVLCLLPLFMILSNWHQVAPPVLFSPLHWMSVECAAKDDNCCWQKNTGLPHFALTFRAAETQVKANLAQSLKSNKNVEAIFYSWQKCKDALTTCSINGPSACLQVALCGLKCWPKQVRTKRLMWLMDSDMAGLRSLTGAGLSLTDCCDLPIHQSKYVKAGAVSSEGQPWPGRRELLYPLHHQPHQTFTSLYCRGEKRWSCWAGRIGVPAGF